MQKNKQSAGKTTGRKTTAAGAKFPAKPTCADGKYQGVSAGKTAMKSL